LLALLLGQGAKKMHTRATAELELELIQPHMAQKPMLRREVGCACVAAECHYGLPGAVKGRAGRRRTRKPGLQKGRRKFSRSKAKQQQAAA